MYYVKQPKNHFISGSEKFTPNMKLPIRMETVSFFKYLTGTETENLSFHNAVK